MARGRLHLTRGCEWVALIGFIVVFGSLIWRISVVGAILAFLLAVAMIGFMFVRSSLKFSPQNRISAGKPLGEPLVDTAILLYSYVAILVCQHSRRLAFSSGLR